MADADADLEGEEVGLVRGLVVEVDVDDGAAGLLVVEGVVLDVAHDLVLLDAENEVADGGSGEHGVFAGVLEEAAVAGVAGEIDTAADGLVVALGAELAADDVAVELGGGGIPGGGGAEDRGEQGGSSGTCGRGHADADGGVCLLERGDAEARDAETWPAPPLLSAGTGSPSRSGPQPMPWTSWIFSSRVSCLRTRSARTSGERVGLDHGKGWVVGRGAGRRR